MKVVKDNKKTLTTRLVSYNLKKGQEITYKKLCEVLKQPYYKSNNQKNAQLKEWSRYFDFEKVNKKYVIKEIYKKPLEPEINPVSNNAIYVKYIECILLQYLSKQNGEPAYFAPRKLWLHLGMINNDFLEYKTQYEKLTEENNISLYDVKNFYDRCNANFPNIIKSSLNSLQRRCLIKYSKPYMLGQINEDGFIEYREATDSEVKYILKTKRALLSTFGVEDEIAIHWLGLSKDYYKTLDETFETEQNWYKVFEAYKIIYNKEDIIETLPQDQLKLEKMGLNNAVINKMNKQAETLYQNEKKINYHDTYVQSQYLLSDKLLKI